MTRVPLPFAGAAGRGSSWGSSGKPVKTLIAWSNRMLPHAPAMSHPSCGNSSCIGVKSVGWASVSLLVHALGFHLCKSQPLLLHGRIPATSAGAAHDVCTSFSFKRHFIVTNVLCCPDCGRWTIIRVCSEHPETPVYTARWTDLAIIAVGKCKKKKKKKKIYQRLLLKPSQSPQGAEKQLFLKQNSKG